METQRTEKIKNNYFDGLKVSRQHFGVFLIVASAYFFEQFDNNNFAYVAPAFMQSMKASAQIVANINFLYYIAMTLGGVLGGIMSDMVGRRKTLLLSVFLFSAGSIASGLAYNLALFTFARAVTGFGIMCMMVVAITYMAELSPAESRGRWEALIAGIGFLSMPLVGVICRIIIPLDPEAWRYILLLGGLGMVAWVAGIFYLKESPRWLVSQGRIEEAEAVVFSLSGVSVDLRDVVSAGKERTKLRVVCAEIFSPLYIKRTLVLLVALCGTAICAQTVVAWVPVMLKLNGFSMEDTLTLATLFAVGYPVGQFLAAYFSDKGGRKIPILIFSLIASAMAVALLFSVSNFYLLAMVGLLVNALLTARSFIIHPYVAESYPTKLRNTVTGLLNSLARFSVSGVQLVIPMLFAGFGLAGVYGLIAIIGVLIAVVVGIFGWRSAHRSLEDINEGM